MATAFHEVRFPTDIAFDSTFGPEYSTDVVTLSNKAEQRNINWSDARYSGDIAPGIKSQERLNVLVAFFHARKGRAYGFRFKDFSDYQAINSPIGVGNGTNLKFQLQKVYVDPAGFTTTRIIKKPVVGTTTITIDDVAVTAFTADSTTGIVTFATAPAASATVRASFEFDVPVRFNTDKMPVRFAAMKLYEWSSVPIIEMRL